MSTETTRDLAAKSGLAVASTPRAEPVPKACRAGCSVYQDGRVRDGPCTRMTGTSATTIPR